MSPDDYSMAAAKCWGSNQMSLLTKLQKGHRSKAKYNSTLAGSEKTKMVSIEIELDTAHKTNYMVRLLKD